MTIRIGINGFGRLGRNIFRTAYLQPNFEVVAIADQADPKVLTYLLNYDSLHRKFPEKAVYENGNMHVQGKDIPMYDTDVPGEVNWKNHQVDVVIDASEKYRTVDALQPHLDQGAHRVVITVPPAQGEENIPFIIRGVNHDQISKDMRIISNGSATAHCLLPVVKVLHDAFGIEKGFMTVVRAFTSEQNLMDAPNPHQLRLSRAAAENIIPSRTWSYLALGKAIPELKHRFGGMSMEVPVPNGSNIDLVTILNKDVTPEEINGALKEASEKDFRGIIEYCTDPIVSTDVVGNHHSAIFDSEVTSVLEGNMVKTVTWYDNDWAFAMRCLDLIFKVGLVS